MIRQRSDSYIVGHLCQPVSGPNQCEYESTRQLMLLARTNNKPSIRPYVNFSTRMSETETAAGNDCDWVPHIVHPREIRDLGIEERCPILISNAWRPKHDTSDARAFRQI